MLPLIFLLCPVSLFLLPFPRLCCHICAVSLVLGHFAPRRVRTGTQKQWDSKIQIIDKGSLLKPFNASSVTDTAMRGGCRFPVDAGFPLPPRAFKSPEHGALQPPPDGLKRFGARCFGVCRCGICRYCPVCCSWTNPFAGNQMESKAGSSSRPQEAECSIPAKHHPVRQYWGPFFFGCRASWPPMDECGLVDLSKIAASGDLSRAEGTQTC